MRDLWLLGLLLSVLAACVAPPAELPEHAAVAQTNEPRTAGVTDAASDQLVARRVAVTPSLANGRDQTWEQAEPLRVPLAWGSHGTEHALEVELSALYTDDTLHLRARWPGAPPIAAPTGAAETTANRLTLHWRIPQTPGAPPPACDVACHTAHTDGAGRLAYVHTETIPPGGNPALAAAGGWQDGVWTLVWNRPLVSRNPYDLQFTDPAQAYPFFVKVFLDGAGRPDAVSKLHELVFEPNADQQVSKSAMDK
jgi:hypothetical protein